MAKDFYIQPDAPDPVLDSRLFESRLIPGDHTPVDVRWRFGGQFDDALAYVGRKPEVWTFDMSPERVARLAMQALPEVDAWVALHSNPGPEHVFIDPASKSLAGIIDFGDAYFSHPVHDLRRFRCPTDRAAIHSGYIAEAPRTDNFEQTWRVACVLADMLAIALNPDCRAAAHAKLSALMPQLACAAQ